MNVTDAGRYAMAVTSSGILALALCGCAVRSSSSMPPSPVTAQDAPPGSQTFNYTGKRQTFIVPAGVTRLTITASGASGGTVGSYTGGRGGLVKAEISVMPGESLSVFVGGSGRAGTRRSFNGGGAGSGSRHHRSGGGGGASDVRLGRCSDSHRRRRRRSRFRFGRAHTQGLRSSFCVQRLCPRRRRRGNARGRRRAWRSWRL